MRILCQHEGEGRMTPTKILMDEHALIRQFVDNLVLSLEKIEEGEKLSVDFFEKAVDFAQNFILKFHHFKEEHLMFGLLAQKRKGEIDGQMDSLRYQHERGRNFISEIRNSLAGYEKCADTSCKDINTQIIIENLASYIHMLRHHIQKEDYIFFPAADIELTEEENEYLLGEFKKEDEKRGGDILDNNRNVVIDMGKMLD